MLLCDQAPRKAVSASPGAPSQSPSRRGRPFETPDETNADPEPLALANHSAIADALALAVTLALADAYPLAVTDLAA
jgi:hypothetical protein